MVDKDDAWMVRGSERNGCTYDVLRLVFDWSDCSDDKLVSLGIAMVRYLRFETEKGDEWDFLLEKVIPILNDFCRTKAEKEWMLSDLAIRILETGLTKARSELMAQEIMTPELVFEPGHEENLEE